MATAVPGSDPPQQVSGDVARYDHPAGNHDTSQAGALFRLMSPAQQALLMDNIAATMRSVPAPIVQRQLGHFAKADPAYGAGVAARLGIAMPAAAE